MGDGNMELRIYGGALRVELGIYGDMELWNTLRVD